MAKDTFAILLFSGVFYLTFAITVDIPQATYEFARGDNATIPCKFIPAKPDNPEVTVSWSVHAVSPDDPDIEILAAYIKAPSTGLSTTIDVDSTYEGRATLQYDIAKGIANLQLISLTSAESRVFECKVNIPKDKTGKPADTTKVVVLVAPTKPICKIQGKAEYGQNINLTCRSEEGTPTPTYQWKRYDVANVLQPTLPPKATVDAASGVLSLYNISSETSGYYVCTSSNKIRSQSTNLTLAVMPPSMNIASTAGIIGGVVAVFLFLLVIIICCCRRKKKEAEEYAMGAPQGVEYQDKEPHEIEEHQSGRVESRPERNANQRDQYEDRSERDYDHQSDRYSDRRDDYDDRRPRSNDRQSDRNDDRRNDRYDDRHSDRYDDRRSDRYDDRRSDRYDDRRDQYDDRDRRDDRRNDRRN